MVEGRRTANVVTSEALQLARELGVLRTLHVNSLQLLVRRYQRLGNEATAVCAVISGRTELVHRRVRGRGI